MKYWKPELDIPTVEMLGSMKHCYNPVLVVGIGSSPGLWTSSWPHWSSTLELQQELHNLLFLLQNHNLAGLDRNLDSHQMSYSYYTLLLLLRILLLGTNFQTLPALLTLAQQLPPPSELRSLAERMVHSVASLVQKQ